MCSAIATTNSFVWIRLHIGCGTRAIIAWGSSVVVAAFAMFSILGVIITLLHGASIDADYVQCCLVAVIAMFTCGAVVVVAGRLATYKAGVSSRLTMDRRFRVILIVTVTL